MIDSEHTRKQLLAFADRANPHATDDAGRLRELAEAVGGSEHTTTWASIDLFAVINPDTPLRKPGAASIASITSQFGWLRILLVFAPIFVTWLGVSQAVRAYYLAAPSDPEIAYESFLIAWESGLDGQIGWATLSNIALIDSLLIGLLMLVSVAVQIATSVVERQSVRQQQDRQQLASVLSDATLCLAPYRHATSLSAGDVQQLMSFARTLSMEARRFTEAGHAIAAESGRLSLAALNLASNVNELHEREAALIRDARALLRRYDIVTREQQQLGARLDTSLAAVRASNDSLVTASSTIASSVTSLQTAQTQLLAAISQDRDAQSSAAGATINATVGLNRALKGIDEYAQQFYSLAASLRKLNDRLPSLVRSVDEFRELEAAVAHLKAHPYLGPNQHAPSSVAGDGRDAGQPEESGAARERDR